MNVQLIRKLIESNKETCPEFTYSNPLLDKNVTIALSKSFMNILKILKENNNSNKKLRYALLENIRKMCKIEPDDHMKINENLTELLTGCYEKQIQDTKNCNINAIDKKLDAFLIRRSKEISINSSFQSNINPEVAQALINLNENTKHNNVLLQDIIHWNQDDKRCVNILKELWNCDKTLYLCNSRSNFFDDTSIKIKTEIEKILLDISFKFLQSDNTEIEQMTDDNSYKSLIETCSVSSECFQICISILNSLFLDNCFNFKIQELIVSFVRKVKECSKENFPSLYPTHLTHFVTLLDFNLDVLPSALKSNYVKTTIDYLKKLQTKSDGDLVMLISHFPQWDSIYFEE